jgi:PTH1 family peptidyl-tRNA hydrolase
MAGFIKRLVTGRPFVHASEHSTMWLFVGLGNPGEAYARQRHNIGFMAVDAIMHDAKSFPEMRKKFKGLYSEASVAGQKTGILKPQTYMNESGASVAQAAKFYKIAADRILVFYDDLDLRPAQIKIKIGGGAAGHNGIRSIHDHLGTPDFWRVRLGIGHPGDKSKVTNHVLGNFAKSDAPWLDVVLHALAQHWTLVGENGPKAYEQAVHESVRTNLKTEEGE